MKLVIIESPYAGDVERNTKYARRALRDSLMRGEAPIASHLLYTQVLNDTIPSQRETGIAAGLAWRKVAELFVFYADYRMSDGMRSAQQIYAAAGLEMEFRYIGENPEPSHDDEIAAAVQRSKHLTK